MKLSEIPVSELKQTSYFHLVDPNRLDSVEDHIAWLEAILHNPCSVYERDGELFLIDIKQLVARVNGLKIEIYPDEHAPPHFHVKSPNINASFDIENCEVIKGKISRRGLDKIKFWHRQAKPVLVQTWNSTRPTNCEVGAYVGT